MREIAQILAGVDRLPASDAPLAVATVVGVRGSAYRRPGARLLVTAGGATVGSVSAGCLEAEVAEAAKAVGLSGVARCVSFDLTSDDEDIWGWGLGCNGVIDVFVQPAEAAVAALRQVHVHERCVALVTVVNAGSAEPGAHLLVHGDGRAAGTLTGKLCDAAMRYAQDMLSSVRPVATMVRSGAARMFVEVLEPEPRLLVCGAGPDTVPLVRFASALGWRIEVADDPARAGARADARTYAVITSHNYRQDRDYLRSLAGSDAAYIGVLGPRARLERLLGDLGPVGDPGRIHGPAGLDLGAEGAEEIAWAIIGEIIAVRRGHSGGFLRDRRGSIHAPVVG